MLIDFIKLKNKEFDKLCINGENEVHTLYWMSITKEESNFAATVGTYGSGISTLLNMIDGSARPTSGSVVVKGKNLENK